jgi:hypothetical protein
MLTQNSEAFRLHKMHCTGCSEYRNHGGAVDDSKTAQRTVAMNAGFDSPPPPPYLDGDDEPLLDRLRRMYGADFQP